MNKPCQKILKAKTIQDFHHALSKQNIVESNPRFLTVEVDITNLCNLSCRMCYFSFERISKSDPIHMNPQAFCRIAASLLDNTKSLTLSLGNEPLCSPHFIDLLQIASKYDIPEVGFSTNGMLLNENIIAAILTLGVTKVIVSVDGAKGSTFEYIRRGSDFDLVLHNVRHLTERKRAMNRLIPKIRFDIVMMRRNISELEDIVILASELGVTELNFAHLVVWKGLDMEQESLIYDKKSSNFWLAKAKQKAKELGLTIVGCPEFFKTNGKDKPIYQTIRYFTSLLSEAVKSQLRPILKNCSGNLIFKDRFPDCLFPFNHVCINSKGHILICPFSHGKPPAGYLSECTSFENIWFNDTFNSLRKKILANNLPGMCRRCSFLGHYRPNRFSHFRPRKFV